jgi:hypothetical protein
MEEVARHGVLQQIRREQVHSQPQAPEKSG